MSRECIEFGRPRCQIEELAHVIHLFADPVGSSVSHFAAFDNVSVCLLLALISFMHFCHKREHSAHSSFVAGVIEDYEP